MIQKNLNIIIGTFLLIFFGATVAFLINSNPLLVSALMLGLPFALLVPFSSTRSFALVILIAIVPFVSIIKGITGIRYAPLSFDIGILLACIFSIIERLIRRDFKLDVLDFLFGAFIIIALLQMFNPNVPGLNAAIEGFRKFAFMSITFYIGRYIIRPHDIDLFQKLILFCSVIIALYGIKQFFFLSPIDYRMIELATSSRVTFTMGGWIRPFSTLSGPFHLGLYLLITILFIASLLANQSKNYGFNVFLLLILSIQLTAIFMTRTKSNWVSLFPAIGIILFYTPQVSKKIFKIGCIIILVASVAVLLAAVSSDQAAYELQNSAGYITNPLQAPTFRIRLKLWREIMIPALLNKPFWGYGTSSAGEGLAHLYNSSSSLYFYSHNQYIKVFLELGIIGFFLFISIIAISINKGRKTLKKVEYVSREIFTTLRWSMAVIISFLVAGIVVPVLDAAPVNYYFWLLLGLLSKKWETGVHHESFNDSIS